MTTATTAVEEAALPPSTPDPQDDECVICCHPFPLKLDGSVYHECCGESICCGCIIGRKRTLIIGENVKKPIAGSKGEELEFMKILHNSKGEIMVCPFCRTKAPRNSKEHLKRIWERIDENNDPQAMRQLGGAYLEGIHGLSKNPKKAEELMQRAYDLGDPSAAHNLFLLYTNSIPNPVLATKYLEEGARRGHAGCMNFLAKRAAQSGSEDEAVRHLMMAACSGHDLAMQNLMKFYRKKWLSKEDFATTLRAHKAANDNAKSEAREYAMRYEDFEEKMISTGKAQRK